VQQSDVLGADEKRGEEREAGGRGRERGENSVDRPMYVLLSNQDSDQSP
jgi:hypothetical protein